MILAHRIGLVHTIENRLRHRHARYFIREELGVARRYQRPDSGHNRNARVFNRGQKTLQLLHIKHGLRDRVLRTSLHLELKSPELMRRVNGRRIYPNANRKARRRTNRIATRIEPAIQVAHEIGETNRIDVKHRSGIGVRPHLGRITRNEQHVAQTQRARAEQVAQHAKQIAVSAAIMRDTFNAHALLNHERCGDRPHAALRARTVGHIDRIYSSRVQRGGVALEARGIHTTRWHDLHRCHECSCGNLGGQSRTLGQRHRLHANRRTICSVPY